MAIPTSVFPLDLIRLQAEALFIADASGRLRYIREPGDAEADLPIAPRFFMGRTRQGNIWRFRHDLPDALVTTLESYCRAEPAWSDVGAPPKCYAAIRAALHAHAQVTDEYRGPAYYPDANAAPTDMQAVVLTEADTPMLQRHFAWKKITQPDYDLGPTTAVLEDGVAVSICFCSRVIDVAAEAGVYTVEAARSKGYARAVVAAWVPAVWATGHIPLYGTSWDNAASQRIANRLGMQCYGEDWSIH